MLDKLFDSAILPYWWLVCEYPFIPADAEVVRCVWLALFYVPLGWA